MVIAVELSKVQSGLDIANKKTSQDFFDLINLKNDTPGLARKCAELGIEQHANFSVAEIVLLQNDKQHMQEAVVFRMIETIKRDLGSVQKMVFRSKEKITVLLSVQSELGIQPVLSQIEEMIDRFFENEELALGAGIGSVYQSANEIGNAYHEAQNALLYQLSRRNRGLLQYSKMGVNRLFH